MYTLKTKDGMIVKTSLDLEKIKTYAKMFLKENKQQIYLFDHNDNQIIEFKILTD